jgi:nucleotide-binding universal stress UspA family protein
MKILVGYSPDQSGQEALALAQALARSTKGNLIAAMVIPPTVDHPSYARVDSEYGAFLRQYAEKALAKARTLVATDIPAEFLSREAPSASEGLLKTAADLSADCIVLGSARAAPIGRFAEGSVTTDVLHSAELPVALAPRGYTADRRTTVKRITCALSGASTSSRLAERAADIAYTFGVPFRLATFVVRDKQMYPTGAGYDAENIVYTQFRRQAEEAQTSVLEELKHPAEVSCEVGDGKTWKAALDSLLWANTELLVVGSSSLGLIMRVFVGSNSGKIVRNSPVPCLVLPRTEE